MTRYPGIVILLLCATCAWGSAISIDFESPSYATGALTGQNGWTLNGSPGGATVYTYSGTGAPVPPGGGNQFVAITGGNTGDALGVSFAGSSEWAITYDIFVDSFIPGNFSAGSFFLGSGAGYQLHAFPFSGLGTAWNARFDVFDSNGNPINGADPGGAFDGLQLDQWYQEQIVINTASNQILSVSIDDPGNPAVTYDPTGWYLRGGASASFSVGSIGIYGTGTLAFDNISLNPVSGSVPEPASWALGLLGAAALYCLRRRRR